MQYWKKGRIIPISVAILMCVLVSGALAAVLLKENSRGPLVYQVQDWLYTLGYLKMSPDGVYGPATVAAVKRFQTDFGLKPDGIVGPATWDALEKEAAKQALGSYTVREGDTVESIARRFSVDPATLMSHNQLTDTSLVPGQVLQIPPRTAGVSRNFGQVELMPWEEVNLLFRDAEVARIIDIQTGLSFLVQRRGGHLHADSEPLTAQDTAIMKQIYGGKWSWDRRPVVVEAKGHWIAASINGMPHGGARIGNNGFKGHFCIHFLGSKLHNTGKTDSAHQAMVLKAAALGR